MHTQKSGSHNLYRAFRREMAKYRLPRTDSHILVAFSGGADSTALLHLAYSLCNAQRQIPRITALHVNHGIRGTEAQRDAQFCRSFCDAFGISFVLYEADAPAEAKERHITLEEAARDIRYRLITQYLSEHSDITAVLMAHHADDQAETVLFRLLRGTSLRGLAGIPEVRAIAVSDNQSQPPRSVPLIRPLLAFSKAELCAYLQEHALSYVTDSTNAENDASRNLLRNDLIPTALKINSAFPDALRRLSRQAQEDESYFSSQVQLFFKTNNVSSLDPIPTQLLCDCHRAISRRVLAAVYDAHRAHCPDLKPLTAVQLDAMLHAVAANGRTLLSDHVVFSAENGLCRICPVAAPNVPTDYQLSLNPGEITPLPDGNACLLDDRSENSYENLHRLKNIYKLFISTHINSDKLISGVYLRPRRDNQTDRYLCGGSNKTAKDALSAHRVPTHLRKTVPLFCDGDGIVWIPFCGIRDSVNPKTAESGAPIFDLYYFYNSEV